LAEYKSVLLRNSLVAIVIVSTLVSVAIYAAGPLAHQVPSNSSRLSVSLSSSISGTTDLTDSTSTGSGSQVSTSTYSNESTSPRSSSSVTSTTIVSTSRSASTSSTSSTSGQSSTEVIVYGNTSLLESGGYCGGAFNPTGVAFESSQGVNYTASSQLITNVIVSQSPYASADISNYSISVPNNDQYSLFILFTFGPCGEPPVQYASSCSAGTLNLNAQPNTKTELNIQCGQGSQTTTTTSSTTASTSSSTTSSSNYTACNTELHYLIPANRDLIPYSSQEVYDGIWNFTSSTTTQTFTVVGSFNSTSNFALEILWTNRTNTSGTVYETLLPTQQSNGLYVLNLNATVPINIQDDNTFQVVIDTTNSATVWTANTNFDLNACGNAQLAYFTEFT
jgi:hypothetical protein